MAKDEKPLFNERIKKHGKWIFILLALIFGAGFVLGGVGSGGVGIIDLLNNGGGNDNNAATTVEETSAIDDAEAAVKAKPEDAAAWVTLGEAALAADKPARAREAAAKAQTLIGKDAALAERNANVWLGLLGTLSQRQDDLQTEIFGPLAKADQPLFPTEVIPGGFQFQDAFAQNTDTVSSALNQRYQQLIQPLQQESDEAQRGALDSYRIVVDARPKDPAAWFQLGRIAEAIGETDTAVEAYRKFLELVPGDPQANQVQQLIDKLAPPETTATTDAATTDAATTDAGAATSGATTG